MARLEAAVTWQQMETKGTPPCPRSGHSLTVVGVKTILFGGCGRKPTADTAKALNSVFTCDVSQPEYITWKEENTTGPHPPPRARHSAVAIDKKRLLIFAGIDHRTRYSDVWVLDTSINKWTQPKIMGEAPKPRAHHTMSVVYQNKVFVFGGYGGHGKVFGDLYVLDLGDGTGPMVWSEPIVKGKGPNPRFDHTCTITPTNQCPSALVIFGGRDNSTIYKDMHLLDLATMSWMEEPGHTPPNFANEVANHVSDAIESVPNYKLFTFGGKKGAMDYMNNVEVLDCGSMVWMTPTVVGKPPHPREDVAMAYDSKTCRLVFFGGWANRWLGDTWTLNVSPIIGPPYALNIVEPEIGPVFGDTHIKCKGINFKDATKIEVKFGTGKTEITVPGTFNAAEGSIEAKTPNYEEYGAMDVDVRVSINGEGWTVNKVRFRYFANTSAKNCMAYGPGLLPSVPTGVEVPFLILSKDTCNARRTSGGDEFVVTVTKVDDDKVTGTVRQVDLDTGIYDVFYSVPVPGKYRISVGYDDLGGANDILAIRGSPFVVDCTNCWKPTKVVGSIPTKRAKGGAQMINLGSAVVLWGGDDSAPAVLTTGDAWNWENAAFAADAPVPPSRRDHSAVCYDKDAMVVFGGVTLDTADFLGDLWFLSKAETGEWSWKQPADVKGYHKRPPKKAVKPAAIEEGAEGAEGDVPAPEAAPDAAPAPPAPEADKPAEVDKPAESNAAPAGDALESGESALEPVVMDPDAMGPSVPGEQAVGGGEPAMEISLPVSRAGAAICTFKDKVLFFGGQGESGTLDDFLFLMGAGTDAPEWMEPEYKGDYISARRGASIIALGTDKVLLFGGLAVDDDGAETPLSDMYIITVDEETMCLTGDSISHHIKGQAPSPRSGATFMPYGKDKIMLFGGVDAAKKGLNEGYVLDMKELMHGTADFRAIYRMDSELAAPGGPLAVVHNNKLMAISPGVGSSRYDVTGTLEPVGVTESMSFVKMMGDMTSQQLAELEKHVDKIDNGLGLASPVEALATSFAKLLTVMTSVFEVRTKKTEIDLAIDMLASSLTELQRCKVNVVAKEKKLEAIREKWEELKANTPGIKAEVQTYQDMEGERIKSDIQTFASKVDEYRSGFLGKPYFTYETGASLAYSSLDSTVTEMMALDKELAELKKLADMFEFPELMLNTIGTVEECREDLVQLKDVWDMSMLCETQFASWQTTLWTDVRTDLMEEGTKGFQKDIKNLPKKVRTVDAYLGLDLAVKNFLVSIPLVADLRSPAMRDRHWKQLMETTKKTFVIDSNFRLADLLKLELHKFEDEVGEIVDRAQKEEKMEVSIAKLNEMWAKIQFVFVQHKTSDVHTIKLAEEDFELLEDNQVLVQGMMANRYMKTFEADILSWNKKLMMVADVNQITSEIQRTWAYLESLFIHSEEVKKELPEAAARFKTIDAEIKKILAAAFEKKNVVDVCATEGLYKNLEHQQSELEVCEKALADYMESKRRAFPRFYFVSTADLLDILSNGNSPIKVMTHMSKCFQAIEKLQLDTETPPPNVRPKAEGMHSCVGKEYVKFTSNLPLEGKVEQYMTDIIQKMRSELRGILNDSVKAYNNPKKRHEWIFDWPSQLILVVNQIYWCTEVEEAFAGLDKGNKDAMKTYNEQQVQQLTDLIKVTRSELKREDRQKVMNMITIDAHSRDIILNIVEAGETRKNCFAWLSQLRTYWDASVDDCIVRICDAVFPYGYEYLGNGARLVITPLTDRIYITATQACWLSMGTAPAGPAGTGKTESTKDLSAQLGKSIYVFNCAPEMDYRTMGDIFKGLAASGSWGCFDEFNRLVPEVLSVCSVQYKCVTDAQKRKTLLPGRGLEYVDAAGTKKPAIQNWRFIAADGIEMPLEEGTSGFITMNPGYIGRAELPESLKALFRPITVMVPDRQLIMENMLMAEGFVEAKMLAKKFASLYYLLEDLLSPQKHYDWGLRAIKSVLVVAGSLLRAEEGQVEADVLFRALRDFNIPKILMQDMVIFMGLLNDLFPGTEPARKRDMVFEKVIVDLAIEMGLTPEDDFILRVVQLSELLAIRHCVFLMGPTGVGRTRAYQLLAKAMERGCDNPTNTYQVSNNRKKVTIRDIDPKAISTQELYGYVNMSTREWKDGLLSFTMRELANIPNEDPKWIMLDGDLDANWIESMNSVMDDNRLLTLPSNERIRLLTHMKLIFEIRDLKFATPATATRAGILYVSEGTQWNSMAQSWIATVVQTYAEKAKWKDPEIPKKWLRDLFAKYVPATIFEIKKSYNHLTPLATMNWVTSLVNILEGCLKPENLNNKAEQPQFEQYFVFAMIWAFGGALAPKDGIQYRANFDKWWKSKWTTVKVASKGTVYDYYINKQGKFALWTELVQDIEFNSSTTSMSSVFVPTSETASLMYFLDMMISLKKPIMFVGGAGFGKTQLVKGKLATLAEGIKTQTITFNYFTDVITFQKILESQLEKKAGINYGPPGQSSLIYFVDDLNMPKLDPYETAMPISHIRQHLGWGHWFDRAKLTQKNINSTQYVSCMNPTAGSFIINPRLQRLFMTLAMDFPSQDSLMKIYGTFMTGHLKRFNADCQELGNKIIQATLGNHEKVSSTFRKTAINFHYEFTVRHLSNVFQGLLMSTPEKFNSPDKLTRLWLHECERVYCDRLVTADDQKTYNTNVQGVVKKFFKMDDIGEYYKKDAPKPLIFCHFAAGLGERVYNDVATFEVLEKILHEALSEYNETNAVMNLVLFEDAMKHICRISRIIANPGGHALLVGVGGSGKQSLSKLSAHISGMSTYMIVISGTYSVNNLKEDLQKMYKRAGLKGEGIMFLFTDSQITDERFMVFINDLLASGEIPDLFAAEDKDEIINGIRGEVKSAGLMDTREICWDFFIQKVRANLHMVFTCSPVGEQFRIRAQRFLAMVTSTVIDWFQPWPEKALLGVAKRFLDEIDLGTEAIRDAVVNFMPFSFSCVNEASAKYMDLERRYNYTTPKTFLELIKLYRNILGSKRTTSQAAIDRLQNGLDKLNKTKKEVDVLVVEANKMSEEVAQKVISSEAFAVKVGQEKEKVGIENAAAQVEAEKCAAIATEVAAKQESCEHDLAAAEPLVAQAEAALDTLNKKDLGETKSLKKPPAGVDDITAVVLVLLQNAPKDRSWQAACKAMNNVDKFIEQLKGYKALIDSGQVPKKSVDACRPYLALEHFNKDIIYNKSRAAAGLCDWAINIIMYYDVVSEVEPKRNELAAANAQLEEANTTLKGVQARVAELNAMVAELERQFAEANKEKEEAILEQAKCERKLGLANRLINALASEGERWALTVTQLKKDYTVLTGDMLLASAFTSYSGCFTSKFRVQLIRQWSDYIAKAGMPMTEGADPLKVLVDDAKIAGWVSEGLPSDRTSVENGTIVTNSERWPLMIDPQLQGIAWIKERESKHNLQVIRMSTPKTVSTMERAIEAGHSVLVENMGESIDAVLNPVITRSTFKKGRTMFVKIGDKEVEYHKDFRLFLHTKLSNPHYPPEIQAETTLINFTVTEAGLEDQLLALVVNKERPDLEETKTALLSQNNEFTIKLKELEDGLLYKLATAEGDITEDVALIESLEESKRVAEEINAKVAEARQTEVNINTNREKYRTVAARGALLFFMLNSLNKVHAFYQFSLNMFVVVFARGIDLSPGGKQKPGQAAGAKISFRSLVKKCIGKVEWSMDMLAAAAGKKSGGAESTKKTSRAPVVEMTPEQLEIRIAALLDTCTYTIFNFTRRGLFDRDKLIVSSLLTLSIKLKDHAVDESEYMLLLRGPRSSQPPIVSDELSQWISDSQWAALDPLKEIPTFSSLGKDMEKSSAAWKAWSENEMCERVPMPGEWGKLVGLKPLLVLRAMRPDRITAGLARYVEAEMGAKYVNQDAFNAQQMVSDESQPSTPIFFILFPGYSPSKEIETLANQLGKTTANGQLTIISMGQGQEPIAENCLDRYTKDGGWVFLDNVHLMQGWVPRLERKLEIAAETAHKDFRCFFSAEPINGAPQAKIIPESILQTCIKVSNEPPSDMKSNMRRAFAAFSQETFDRSSTADKAVAHKSILFALCFYHSLILGRKKFGVGIGTGSGSGLGFCRGYSFNMGDLVNCTEVLFNYLEANEQVPFEDMRYMFAEVFYGGHITDSMDRRCCVSYLDMLVQPTLMPPVLEGGALGPPTLMLAPGFMAPIPTDYEGMRQYIETALPPETPVLYGLHPNAQLSLLTSQGETLFGTIVDVTGGGTGTSSGGGMRKEDVVRSGVTGMLERLPEMLNMIEIESRVVDKTPYVVVALQETERLNTLMVELKRSLEELTLGLDGALNMSDAMEKLQDGIFLNKVPSSWMAQMSTRVQEVFSLTQWFHDVLKRYEQLKEWTKGQVVMPKSVWISGLFNPKAYITAVMQTYARKNKLPLDRMRFLTEVTPKMHPDQITEVPQDGSYCHGLVIEGARWDSKVGMMADSHPKELHPQMPIILLTPVIDDKYNLAGYYPCPVYVNMQRANVYSAIVSTFTLKTKDPVQKWTLASVALLLQDDLA